MAFSSEDYLMITQMPCINGSVCLVCIRLPCSATTCPLNVLLLCTGQQWGRLHLVQVKSLADELWLECTVDVSHFSIVEVNKWTS